MGRKRTKRTAWYVHKTNNSIYYDKINALETNVAEEQVNNQANTSLVPTHIQPSVFVTFCFDNCDQSVESIYNTTLDGANGVIVQQLDKQQVEATENSSTIVNVERRRSFKPIYHKLHPYITGKERKSPIPIKQVNTNINQLDGMPSKQRDLSWLLLRYRNKDNHLVGRVSFMKSPKKSLTPILFDICLIYASQQQIWMFF